MQHHHTNLPEKRTWPKKYEVRSDLTKIGLVNSMLVNISTAQVALGCGFYEQAAVSIKKSLGYLAELEMQSEHSAWLPIFRGGRANSVVNEFFKKTENPRIKLLRSEAKETNAKLYSKPILKMSSKIQ